MFFFSFAVSIAYLYLLPKDLFFRRLQPCSSFWIGLKHKREHPAVSFNRYLVINSFVFLGDYYLMRLGFILHSVWCLSQALSTSNDIIFDVFNIPIETSNFGANV